MQNINKTAYIRLPKCTLCKFVLDYHFSTNASSCGSKRSKEQGVRHKCRSLFLWLAPCRALRSVPIMGTEIVTAHSVRLFRPRIARPYDSPYLHHLPKTRQVRVFFSFCLGQMVEIKECTPDDAFFASVRLHAIAPRHIRVSPYPNGDRCKATPL